jgi:hypothetical protein|tara:strand:- start:2301 stop:2708 length:408 start_codon:yes stop_codon:yes gene_type:complete
MGKQNTITALGVHSGGNFPEAGHWEDVSPSVTTYDEWVNANEPTISYSSFFDNYPEDDYGLVILPDVDDIDYNANPEMFWFKVQTPWGDIYSDSYYGWINQFLFIDDSGDTPPSGPRYRDGWDDVGSAGDKYESY